MKELNAITTIAYRDFLKFLRDKSRIIISFIFPFIFIGILGTSLQSNIGEDVGFNFLIFTFTGVLAQTLFQSTASGVISLIEDRENDFSQEMFVSPISRYSIIAGKIIGESVVAFVQIFAIIVFGFILRVPLSIDTLLLFVPIGMIVAFFGGSFGVLVLSNLSSQRVANQIFPFIILPQFFLAGVFNPIKEVPGYLFIVSRIAPMTYAVDLFRSVYYIGNPQYSKVVLHSLAFNLLVISCMSIVFITIGTFLFIKKERNK